MRLPLSCCAFPVPAYPRSVAVVIGGIGLCVVQDIVGTPDRLLEVVSQSFDPSLPFCVSVVPPPPAD